jgi:hypothetical protein
MKQAFIKKTGEIFNVVSEYSMVQLTFELPIDFPDKDKFEKKISSTWIHEGDQVKMKTGKEREDYYVLSNGETYEVDDLAVGLDEIRDWKLKNNLNI